jgi:glycosyltransferase involved in cell wall biosynthesis
MISVANLRPEKCLDVLLMAFAQVVQVIPDAELTLVGDGPLRGALEAQAGRLGVSRQVRFTGAVSDIWPLLAKADLFVLPSRYETLGIAALEAMAAGLPVMASNVGGLKELVAPGVTGELVEPGNPDALAEQLIALLRSPETLWRMGKAAQERAAAQRADGMVDAYEKLYVQITS